MRSPLFLLPLLSLPLGLACGDKDDDTGGNEYWSPHCDVTETALAFDEVSPLGFSAAELATGIGSALSADLSWSAGGSTPLSLGLAWASDAVFVDLEEAPVPDGVTDVPAIGVICDDYLEVGATLSLDSDDGLLAESLSIDLQALQVDAATFSADVVEGDFSDPAIFDPFDVKDATSQGPRLSGSFFAGGGSDGVIGWFSEGSDGEVAWASIDTVASWSSDDEPD